MPREGWIGGWHVVGADPSGAIRRRFSPADPDRASAARRLTPDAIHDWWTLKVSIDPSGNEDLWTKKVSINLTGRKIGGPCRCRTDHLLLAKQALSRMSQGPLREPIPPPEEREVSLPDEPRATLSLHVTNPSCGQGFRRDNNPRAPGREACTLRPPCRATVGKRQMRK